MVLFDSKYVKFIATCLVFFLGVVIGFANDPIKLSSANGASIEATPLKLDMGTLTIRRIDNQQFTLPLSSLDQASQEAVRQYFNRPKGDLAAPPGQAGMSAKTSETIDASGSAEPVIQLSRDGETIERVVFQDRLSDYMKMHQVDELDLIQVVITRKGSRTMGVELTFDPVVGKSLLDSEYRVWFNVDVDNDQSTGMTERRKEGVDIGTAIHGNGSGRDWTYYNVSKSDEGKDTELEVDNIKIGESSIAFDVECDAFRRTNVFGLAMVMCKDGGKVLDHFPDSGPMPFSFNYEKHQAANAN